MSSESDTMINCVNVRCNLLGFSGSGSVQVDINARLDERFFSVSINYCNMHPHFPRPDHSFNSATLDDITIVHHQHTESSAVDLDLSGFRDYQSNILCGYMYM